MARDPYQYFRVEARELLDGLGKGVLQLEKGAGPEVTANLLRLAHTLKGAARVVRQAPIAEKAHAIEDALATLRGGGSIPGDRIERALQLLDGISADLAALDGTGAAAAAAPDKPAANSVAAPIEKPAPDKLPAPGDDLARTVRADVGELDALMSAVTEAGNHLRGMRKIAGSAQQARRLADLLVEQSSPLRAGDPGRAVATAARLRALADELRTVVAGVDRALVSGFDQAERQMQEVRTTAEGLRLLPVHALFGALERTARDAARSLSKQVSFAPRGGEVRVEAQVLSAVQAALVQMVRNAVAHGIEAPAQRRSAGKPAAGKVSLEISRRGHRVAFVVRDDGAGIDLPAVRRAAGAAAAGLDDAALVRRLLQGGLSTAGAVTEVAGRGIGLDVVRAAAVELGGEVSAETSAGVGTAVTLLVPVSLSSLEALLVEAGGVTAAIPLDSVKSAVRLVKADVASTARGASIQHEGEALPMLPLSSPLAGQPFDRAAAAFTAVVVAGGSARAALAVDRLLGTASVVVRRLPALAPADPVIAGATFDGEGNPRLVLDPAALVAAATRGERAVKAEEAAPPASILVIDDSLTTRMLEQSILESAGYQVTLATSAEEGLEKARERRFDLFLVDVEMPGMDGFTFVERTRADAVLGRTPAILVTSRDSADDKRRGHEAGAHAYIVKGEFDQGRLLDTIRRLVG